MFDGSVAITRALGKRSTSNTIMLLQRHLPVATFFRIKGDSFDDFSSFLSSCHEKAAEALWVGRIQTRLEVVFVPEFSV